MIEPTDEMVTDAVQAAAVEGASLWRDEARAVVAAALAIVERDYVLIRLGAPGSRCACDMRPRPLHEHGSPGCYAHVEPGMCRCRPGESQHEFGVKDCQGFAS